MLVGAWTDEIKAAYTNYANLNGPDATKMKMTIGMYMRNMARSGNPDTYKIQPNPESVFIRA